MISRKWFLECVEEGWIKFDTEKDKNTFIHLVRDIAPSAGMKAESGFLPGIEKLPSAQPEPLTDKEQRIFLAAMGREEKICEEVDRNFLREPYEDSLMEVCKEIRRKVKGVLWT